MTLADLPDSGFLNFIEFFKLFVKKNTLNWSITYKRHIRQPYKSENLKVSIVSGSDKGLIRRLG